MYYMYANFLLLNFNFQKQILSNLDFNFQKQILSNFNFLTLALRFYVIHISSK